MRRTVCKMALLAAVTLVPAWARAGEQEDKQFAKQIAAQIRDGGQVQNYSIGVKCKDGTVWLAGRVNSPEQLNAALECVQNIDGVEKIVNSLSVSPAPAVKQAVAKAPVRQSKPQGQQVRYAEPEAIAPGPPAGGYETMPGPQQQMGPGPGGYPTGRPIPAYAPTPGGAAPAVYDQPHMPNYAWPSYAPYPNYAALTYPRQYSASAWPFIGPFYPYPQVPMGWRKVSLEWDDGWWFLDFHDHGCR